MNDNESYIAIQVRSNVWSGLYDADEVHEIICQQLEGDENYEVDEENLCKLIAEEFARKQEAEKSWPEVTDCDRLETAFDELNRKGVIAIHNASWDKRDAFHNCLEAYREAGSPQELFGICYYTTQDIESVVDGEELCLGFSSTRAEDEATDAPKAAELICSEIKAAGLTTDWNGDASTRIEVQMKWQLRSRG